MPLGKRLFDLGMGAFAALLLVPVLGLLALTALLTHGRPVFFVSERMAAPGRAFAMVKLRSMATDPADAGVSGGDKDARITAFGGMLRRTRLDEIPQLVNVARGDMSLVGPRPPLRRYVEAFPDIYARVLRCRPGVTGLASLVFAAHEARLLAACRSPDETETVYVRRCIPRKARIDLIYARNWSILLDLWLLGVTVLRALHLIGGRRTRLPRRRGPQRPRAPSHER